MIYCTNSRREYSIKRHHSVIFSVSFLLSNLGNLLSFMQTPLAAAPVKAEKEKKKEKKKDKGGFQFEISGTNTE